MANDQDKPEQAEQNAKPGAPIVGTVALSMIERVARAIHAKHNAADGNEHWFYEDPSKCRHSQQLARAAIEAMREPTDEMVKAADGPVVDLYRADDPSYEPALVWEAMIDAALNAEVQP